MPRGIRRQGPLVFAVAVAAVAQAAGGNRTEALALARRALTSLVGSNGSDAVAMRAYIEQQLAGLSR